MADVLGLSSLHVHTVRADGHTFNQLVLQFENGEQVRVPLTEATAAEVQDVLQRQPSRQCNSPLEASPLCGGCQHCDPAHGL